MVVVDDQMSVLAGMKLTEEILKRLDFRNIRFVRKKATSNYYAPDTEYEVYSGDIEVADIGMYSPVALAQYDIPINVFNLGFGLERFIMAKEKVSDVRELLYPQFYGVVELTDEQMTGEVRIEKTPRTEDGVKLAEAVKKTAIKYANEKSPCSYTAFDGRLWGKNIKVEVLEREENTMLLGPAALNEIYVYESGVYGLPKDASKLKANVADIKDKGIKLDFGFIDAISSYFASRVEDAVSRGEKEGFIQIKMAKSPADVNLSVSEQARRFIESKNKPISIKGPVFTALEFTVVGG
jgi:O-phosphoseryl-tRNA synthetase